MIATRIPIDDQSPWEQKIAQAIVQLLAMPQTLEQIQESLDEQNKRIVQLEKAQIRQGQTLQESEGSIQKLTQGIEAFYQRQQCVEQASERLSLLSQQHYDRHVIEPLTRRVFPLMDMLSEASQNSEEQHSDILEAVQADLHELLAGYGVEPISVSAGGAFDAKTMQPVQLIPTHRKTEDKAIQSMIRPGFRCDKRILRPAMVVMYRFEGSKHISRNLGEER